MLRKTIAILLTMVIVFSMMGITASASTATAQQTAVVQKGLNYLAFWGPNNVKLTVDGVWGANTNHAATNFRNSLGHTYPISNQVNVHSHVRDQVINAQRGINAVYSKTNIPGLIAFLIADGDAGPATESATRAFQTWYNNWRPYDKITVDGVMGPQTRRALFNATNFYATNNGDFVARWYFT